MVSIIIPVYNAEARLRACVDSVLAQSFRDFELILIDDGSRDRSFEICQDFARQDPRVRAFTQENSGVSATRNRGLSLARGEYVEFVDSDDTIRPQMVEKLVTALEQDGADLAVCGITRQFPDHQEMITPLFEGVTAVSRLQQDYPDVLGSFVLYSPVNKLYRREKIRTGFSPELSLGEDFVFNLQYLRGAGTLVFLRENLYVYLVSEGSLAKKYRPDGIDIAERLYREGLDFCRDAGLTQPAVRDLTLNFLNALFYGLSDLYFFTDGSAGEKRRAMTEIVRRASVRQALGSAEMPQRRQHLAQQLLQHNHLTAFHLMLSAQARLRRHSARS